MIIPSLTAGLLGKETVPAVDLVPGASFARHNLLTKLPSLGFVDPKMMDKPAMHNATTSISTSRRVLNCRNDLTHVIGRPAKTRFALNQTSGVGRNTTSVFPREYMNNGRIMIPTDNIAIRPSKLGIP